ncbi:uncharacterized protein Dwil_GK13544 [Drosophila willistoni]|uniref:TIR domain-containing protein n=1 Tax=Drosophila willistoni TaxID=7260 RepID=B4NIA8_DROWI|nr:protein toll [Drosophila willistoni]EDW83690.1 uncharacterized protein Dwil_GK13544 [Drosophila willistoni]
MRRLNAASRLLLVLVVQQMSHWPTSKADFGRDECNELSSGSSCQCQPSMSEYEIYCPANIYNPTFKLTKQRTSNVQIECFFSNHSEYKQLPELRIGNIDSVQIQRCPLPGHTPISGILNHLGIPTPKMLIFESNNLGVNLTRKHLDHLQNLKRLRITSRLSTHIPFDLLSDLRNLNWLDLRVNVVELPAQLFANLESLEFLELGNNGIRQLPHGIFRSLHKLQHLNLWSNHLRNLSKHDFEGVSSVSDVDLSGNGIEQLPPDVFALLTNLSEINLNGNRFRSLPENLFEHNRHLKNVRLLNNRVALPTLPPRLFANLPELKVILVRCDLETVSADLFENSVEITNITLRDNNLSTLPAKLLQHQINLLSLDLRQNKLTHLPDTIFANTKNLVDLNLADNLLTEISADIFGQLTNLETLSLSRNHLRTINNRAFDATTQLRELNLEHNHIDLQQPLLDREFQTGIGSPFSHLQHLQTLNLRNNSIMFIYGDWKYSLVKLRKLDLSYNNLSSLDYEDLQFLSQHDVFINMTHNKIRSINFYEFLDATPSKSFVRVDLNRNPLVCDCVAQRFIQLVRGEIDPSYAKKLELLTDQLSCSEPSALVDRPVRFVDPRELYCSFDKSEDPSERVCPRGCDCLVRTIDHSLIVNCSNGNLTKVPKLPILPSNLHLMELHMENNTLLRLPSATSPGYENVTSLHLSGNNITQLSLGHLPLNLHYLDVSRNSLQGLDPLVLGFFNHTLSRHSLKLSQNPWVCNCSAKPLLLFMQNNFETIADRRDIYCMDAEVPTRMEDLVVNDICPQPKGLWIALAVVIALTGFLAGITAALYYKYQIEIKIWLYAHNLCMWFVTEEELDRDKKFDAFISYSHKDQSFIEQYLVPQLEHGPQKFQLCVHERDWLVGGFIPENIVRSVADSRRTIIVLSQNFIESEWARMEFRAAHRSALNEGRARIIVIIYSDIGDTEKLDEELKAYLKMNTYLKWGDPWFWDKLRYALPHRNPLANMGNGALVKSALKGSTDDKLELIKPSPVTPPLTTPPAEATKNPLVAQLNGGTPHTAIMIANGKNGLTNSLYAPNGKANGNGHINGAFIINTNAKQSDV